MASSSADKAIALYVVLARDVGDFLEMLTEETDIEALTDLYLMLVRPNPNPDHQELNDLGANLVKGAFAQRGVPLPKRPEPRPPEQGSLF